MSLRRSPRLALVAAVVLATVLAASGPGTSSAQFIQLPATTGNLPWLTILCRASDVTYPQADPVAWFSRLMTDEAPGFDHYWREVSYGQMNIAGSRVVGVYTLPGGAESYFELVGPTRFMRGSAVTGCIEAADPDVVFPDFAGINVIFPGLPAWGGFVASEASSLDFSRDGQQKVYGLTKISFPDPGHSYLGHEWAHALGLLHSSGPYDSEYDSSWDVVSGGRYAPPGCNNLFPEYRCAGQHTIAYHKSRLGWIPAERTLTVEPGSVHRIELGQLATMPSEPGVLLYVRVPFTLFGEFGKGFYTLEARRQVGYDKTVPGNAVVIHTVDEWTSYSTRAAQVVDVDGNGNANDAGAMWTPGETFVQTQGGVTVIMCVEAETATGFTLTVASNASACGVSVERVHLPLIQR